MKISSDFVWLESDRAALISGKTSPKSPTIQVDPPGESLCSILVIDDEPALQRLIAQALSPGAKVLQEFSGESEAIDSQRLEEIDLVILDYKMSGKNGLKVLQAIREKNERIPVLFMTGFGDLDIARRAIAGGANEYFAKPFDPVDLRRVVAKWVPAFDANLENRKKVPSFEDVVPLTNPDEEENYVVARLANGEEFFARVIRYNARSVVVEADLKFADLVPGTELEDTTVTMGKRAMDIAGAVIQKSSGLADRCWLEIGLPGVWQIEGQKPDISTEKIAKSVRGRKKLIEPVYSRLEVGFHERSVIPNSFRATITDFENILQELYDDLEPFERLIFEIDKDERHAMEERMIDYAAQRFFPILSEAMARFEDAAGEAERLGILREFRNFAQKRLYPHILCSPFIARVIAQPIGVPGDFGILGQLLGHPYQGHSLYSRLLNAWAITASPSAAYRYRIDLLGDAINDTVSNSLRDGRTARILSMASGVAYEVQRYVMNPKPESTVDFELVDFSNRTLHEAKKQFNECQKVSDPAGVQVMLRQGSVIDLAKDSKRSLADSEKGQYDLVYCAGLFDYLSSRLCSKVVSYLYELTKPGGKMIVSNYTPENASRYFMGVVLDWELIHRTTDEFHDLMQKTTVKDYKIVEDHTRTELYAIAEK